MKKSISAALIKRSLKQAQQTQKRAHAPYSHYQVGASVGFASKIFSGCNVENVVNGGSICAEQNALIASVAAQGMKEPDFLLVFTDDEPAAQPCAICLQVLSEFTHNPNFPIYLANKKGIQRQLKFRDLLPQPFASKKVRK